MTLGSQANTLAKEAKEDLKGSHIGTYAIEDEGLSSSKIT